MDWFKRKAGQKIERKKGQRSRKERQSRTLCKLVNLGRNRRHGKCANRDPLCGCVEVCILVCISLVSQLPEEVCWIEEIPELGSHSGALLHHTTLVNISWASSMPAAVFWIRVLSCMMKLMKLQATFSFHRRISLQSCMDTLPPSITHQLSAHACTSLLCVSSLLGRPQILTGSQNSCWQMFYADLW